VLANLATSILALVLFSWLGEKVFEGETKDFDTYVRGFIHQYSSPPLTSAIKAAALEILSVER